MSVTVVKHVLSIALLAGGVGVVLVCCIGIVVANDTFDRLHFITPASTIGIGFISLAIILSKPLGSTTLKIALLFVITVVTSPILSHATARAARIRRFAEWRIYPEELADDDQRERRTGRDEEARRIRELQASLAAEDVSPTLARDGGRGAGAEGGRQEPTRRSSRPPDKEAVVWRILAHMPGLRRPPGDPAGHVRGGDEVREVRDRRVSGAPTDASAEETRGEEGP